MSGLFDIFSNWGFNSPNDNKRKLGYYEKKQKELESNIGQVNVGPARSINLDYNKKTGNIGEPHLGSGWGINTMQTKNTQNRAPVDVPPGLLPGFFQPANK